MQFLHNAVAYYRSLGVTFERLLTDNGSAFRSKEFAKACQQLGIRHRYTRPYRPQTWPSDSSSRRFASGPMARTQALDHWLHHYDWHRPHQGIGGVAPMTRLSKSRNNLLTLHN